MTERNSNILNETQVRILVLIAVETAQEEIANKLCISIQAVRKERHNILKAIGAANLLPAVLLAALRLQGLRDLIGYLSTTPIEFVFGCSWHSYGQKNYSNSEKQHKANL